MRQFLSKCLRASCVALFCLGSAQAAEADEAEALAVRRIVGLWKENEAKMVRQQIEGFLKQYPNSKFSDQLHLMLGDIEFSDARVEAALKAYSKVRSEELRQGVSAKILHALVQLGRWDDALEMARPYLEQGSDLYEQALFVSAKALFQKAQKLEGSQRDTLFKQAQAHCETLLTEGDDMQAAALLAEIHRALGEADKGIRLYEELARKYPEKREAFLFQSAAMQLTHNQGAALHTLRQVQQINGELRGQAAFHELVLLLKMGRYRELVDRSTDLAQQVPDDKIAISQFYIGRAYFELKNYSKATQELASFSRKSDADPQQRQLALLMLLQSAQKQGNSTLAQQWYTELEDTAMDTEQLPRALVMLAQTYAKRAQYTEALATLDELLRKFPDDAGKEAALQLKVSLLYKQGQLEASRKAAISFIENYPTSESVKAVYHCLPIISLSILEQNKNEETQQAAVNDLKRCIASSGIFTQEEEANYQLKLARILSESGHSREAERVLGSFIDENKHSPLLYQAHYLMAIANYQSRQDYNAFAFHAEHVLTLEPKLPQRLNLKRNLFTAYMQLSNACRENQSDDCTLAHYREKAAQHLFDLMKEDPESMEDGQLLWLANYYYEKVEAQRDPYLLEPLKDPDVQAMADNGIDCYRRVLKLSASQRYLPEGEELLAQERHVLRLATLLGWQARIKQQIPLLEQLMQAQTANSELNWRSTPETQFSLAYAYEQMGQWGKAMEQFQALRDSKRLRDPRLQAASQLHFARTRYQNLAKSQKAYDTREIDSILKLLEELEIRRVIANEPIHLEAAIDRAEIQASLCAADQADQKLLELLSQVKVSFTNRDDLWSKDYHASRESLPQQDHIYQAYIMLIDARRAYLQMRIEEAAGNSFEGSRKAEAARTIFSTLLGSKFSVSRYLIHQAESNLKAMDESSEIALPEFCDEPRSYF